jgi:hypothetical protein
LRHPLLRGQGLVAARSVLRIGGIALDTTSSLPFHGSSDATYLEFLAGAPDAGDAVIAVELEQGDPAPAPGARRTFDTGSAWSAYTLADGDSAIVMALPASRDTPLLQARFDRDVTRVRVVCSTELAVDGRFYNPIRYPLDQLLMMQRLAREGGAILHCALVDVGGTGVICPGVSGAGKTTLARQLVNIPGFRVLSDDRAVIRRTGDGYRAFGTPWPGEGGFAINQGLPLVGIGFIQQREVPITEPITRSQAIHRLVRVASVPWYDRDAGPRVFDGLADLCGRVPTWLLGVPPDASAVAAVRALAEGRPLQAGY